MTDGELAAKRLKGLLELIGRVWSFPRGWQTRAAEIVGVHASYVSRVMSGSLTSIGGDVAQRVSERVALPVDYFSEADDSKAWTILSAAQIGRLLEKGDPFSHKAERLDGSLAALLDLVLDIAGSRREMILHWKDSDHEAVGKMLAAAVLDLRAVQLAREVNAARGPAERLQRGTALLNHLVGEASGVALMLRAAERADSE